MPQLLRAAARPKANSVCAGRRAARRDRAQALMEFAMVVPLFLLLLFGVMDFTRLLFSYISLTDGTREMARVIAVSANTDANAPIDAFNNYTILAGAMNPLTDSVVVNVYDATGTLKGNVTCTLPLTHSGCTLPSTAGFGDGWVDITTTYVFQWSPLFQNRLSGVIDVSLMRPASTLSTTVRSYVE